MTERSLFELAEAWVDSWPEVPQEDLPEELALYQAVIAIRARAIPYVPSTPVAHEALEQAATELDRQKRDGWHLIPKVVDGKPVRYLETGS